MKANDVVYDQIYRGALKAGARERAALDAAVTGLEDFKKNRFKKPSQLIEKKIAEAVKRVFA